MLFTERLFIIDYRKLTIPPFLDGIKQFALLVVIEDFP